MFHHEKILGKTGKQSCLRKKILLLCILFFKKYIQRRIK